MKTIMDLKNKRALVIGLADSGRAAVRFLIRQGARVTATDLKAEAELGKALDDLSGTGVELKLGAHPPEMAAYADLVITSPGVPKDAPILVAAKRRGIPVLSELELASRFVAAPIVAVTGTNGKSTVVELIGHLLRAAWGGDRVFVGGNIGTPFLELPLSGRSVRAAVIEVSSFQLEFADTLHPRVAVMLNITPDHLDRYRDFEEYADYKWRLFRNQGPEDDAVVNLDDPVVASRMGGLKARVVSVSIARQPAAGMKRQGEKLVYQVPGQDLETLPLARIPLHGQHNLVNVMAAVCAARAMGVSMTAIADSLPSFQGLAHRFQLVREVDGVEYINDSKATNAGAVAAGVKGLDRPVVLLMGGQAKGCSFRDLARELKGRVKAVMAFGESRDQIAAEMGLCAPVRVHITLAEALASARAAARPGEAVLLAPGCASFDQFQNYKHRGEVFARLVRELP
jgi:UDP-N-acetylmuramoylalanine--D-glutamate ligase